MEQSKIKKPNFSCVVICRNESKTLPRLVASVKEFMDAGGEFIALDTGSIDGTAQIARDLGCKVEEVGDRFRRVIDHSLAASINGQFVQKGELPVVSAGDSLFDFASARNYAASLAENTWIFMPDCDEILTAFDLEKIEEAIVDPEVTRCSYDFVFAHDAFNKPTIQFLHSKFYRRDKLEWHRIVHECLYTKL